MSSEAANQQRIRLHAPSVGARLWRNNNGACTTDDGRFVRFGLGNDSEQINRVFKSSDLIGIRKVLITQDMVGKTIGQFMAVEVKRTDFVARESDKRYVGQRNFIDCVNDHGGFGVFAKDVLDVFPMEIR